MKNFQKIGLALCVALLLGACDLELTNPNLPSTDDVLGTPDGIILLARGMQAEYSGQLVDPVYVTGLVTDEIGAGAATFDIYQDLDAKAEPDVEANARDPSVASWAGQYRVIHEANNLITHAPQVGLGSATVSGIVALAELYKAMALGNLIQIFESVPVTVGPEHPDPAFLPRAEVLDSILGLLDSAKQRITTTPPSSEFFSQVVASGLDLANTIDAMTARYALIAGDLALADQAAGEVDLGVLSLFEFTANDPNPLYGMWYASGNAYQMRPEDHVRLQAEAGDQRVAFWVEAADITGAIGPLDELVRYETAEDDYPAYLPQEMTLIRAEVAARNNQLLPAIELINEVRTQCTSPVDEPLACLDAVTILDLPTQQDVLDEILKQRAYELYLQAVRWSDLRRFGVALPADYTFMPVPVGECDRNESVPAGACP